MSKLRILSKSTAFFAKAVASTGVALISGHHVKTRRLAGLRAQSTRPSAYRHGEGR
jgi:hypothetical protein